MPQKRTETVNRSSYLLEQLIPVVEHQLVGVPGVETLLRKLRNETWRHGRKEAAIFHAERALAYHRVGKLKAIEQYLKIGNRRAFFDLLIEETNDQAGQVIERFVELKNWKGWHQWHEITREQRLAALEIQMERYTAIGKIIRLEFKGFIPQEVASSQEIRKLKAQGKLELQVIEGVAAEAR